MTQSKQKCWYPPPPKIVKGAVFDQPTVKSGRVTRGRFVAVDVGCWLFSFQQHFHGTSMALPWYFNFTVFMALASIQCSAKKTYNFTCAAKKQKKIFL